MYGRFVSSKVANCACRPRLSMQLKCDAAAANWSDEMVIKHFAKYLQAMLILTLTRNKLKVAFSDLKLVDYQESYALIGSN